MGRLTVTVAVRMQPEDAAAVRAEAQRSGRSLAALLLAGAGRPAGATAAEPGGMTAALPPGWDELCARVDELAADLAELRGDRRRGDRREATATTTAVAGYDVEPTPAATAGAVEPPTVPRPARRRPDPRPTAGTLALRAWQEAEGVTVRELAERIGRPRGTVGAWLTGRQHPPADARELLAELTGIAPTTWED